MADDQSVPEVVYNPGEETYHDVMVIRRLVRNLWGSAFDHMHPDDLVAGVVMGLVDTVVEYALMDKNHALSIVRDMYDKAAQEMLNRDDADRDRDTRDEELFDDDGKIIGRVSDLPEHMDPFVCDMLALSNFT